MFSVNSFYDYLMHCYSWPRKNNFVYWFHQHGSRDVYQLRSNHPDTNKYYTEVQNNNLQNFYGGLFAFDQEPIDFDQLYFDYSNQTSNYDYHNEYSTKELVYQRIAKVYTPVILHSELNSKEVKYFTDMNYLDAHYWYHGLISRDWFRHWKHYTTVDRAENRLGCYIRDTTGTREYRKDVLELIQQEGIYCPLLEGTKYSSDASAMLEWDDTGRFDIQVVAETLFDTPKTHLTEKVLKPVAMEQPFILFAGPHSLEYMRRYGFQTFDCCWDERYDEITNTQERYQAIQDIVKHLNSMPDSRYRRIIERAKLIAKNNREHFYSQHFEDQLLKELHTNIERALAQQQENFFTSPGGEFFKVAHNLQQYQNGSYPQRLVKDSQSILKHIQKLYPSIAKQIVQQYPKLFNL